MACTGCGRPQPQPVTVARAWRGRGQVARGMTIRPLRDAETRRRERCDLCHQQRATFLREVFAVTSGVHHFPIYLRLILYLSSVQGCRQQTPPKPCHDSAVAARAAFPAEPPSRCCLVNATERPAGKRTGKDGWRLRGRRKLPASWPRNPGAGSSLSSRPPPANKVAASPQGRRGRIPQRGA